MISFSSIVSGQKDLYFSRVKGIGATSDIYKIEVKNKNVFIGSNNGVYRLNNEIVEYIADSIRVIDFAFDNDSLVYMTDGNNIYDNFGKKVVLESLPSQINGIEYFEKQIVLASNTGLYYYAKKGGRPIIKNTSNSPLKSNQINFVHVDKNKKIWLGTAAGEVRISGDKWQAEHENFNVTKYSENKEGVWLYGEDKKKKGVLYLIDQYNRFYDAGFGQDLSVGKLNDFAIDDNGILYFTSDEFIMYDPYKDQTYNFSKNAGYISSKCSTTFAQGDGVIYLGTFSNGLFKASTNAENLGFSINCIIDKPLLCTNSKSAAIKVLTFGGKAPFNYIWENPAIKGDNPNGLSQGNYSVTVVDANGASDVCFTDIKNPDLFFVDLVSISPIKSKNGKDGKIEVQGIGGTPPFKYKWTNGSSKNINDNLSAGTYEVVITDKNGCTASGSYILSSEKVIEGLDITKLTVGKILNVEELYFKADSSVLIESSYKVLNEIYSFLIDNKKVVIEIGGHTNMIPPPEYCNKLSTDRARTVAEFLYEKGIPKERIAYIGYGKSRPLSKGTSQAENKKNQRVEVKILAL